ncbi:hypothetical protein RY975_000368 [Citrobacter braakii]|uniref:hypothetical protein n=1 Tax=Citrobacter sp. 506 TaxID=3156447 RepID=UPI0029096554|nr:hypothetical protein [Citrobacter braakii]
MSDFGFDCWHEDGSSANFGIKPISIIGTIKLSAGQTSGTYSFNVPAGKKLGYMLGLAKTIAYVERRRTITVSGNSIVIGAGTDNSLTQPQANESYVLVFLENA